MLDSLRTAETQCSQMGPEMSETTNLNWIVAESDIQQIQEAGLFPESVLQSAGMFWCLIIQGQVGHTSVC